MNNRKVFSFLFILTLLLIPFILQGQRTVSVDEKAEIKKIVEEVLGDMPDTMTEMESKIEELENENEEQARIIKKHGSDIESLKSAVQSLQDFQNSQQGRSE